MKKETLVYANSIRERISSIKTMQETLKETFHNLRNDNNMEDAQALANLIYELMDKPKGDSVVNSFVNHFLFKLDNWIIDLEKEFSEI